MTADICRERDITPDWLALKPQWQRSVNVRVRTRPSKWPANWNTAALKPVLKVMCVPASMPKVLALYRGNQPVDRLVAGEEGVVVRAFYAEGGGVGVGGFPLPVAGAESIRKNPDQRIR